MHALLLVVETLPYSGDGLGEWHNSVTEFLDIPDNLMLFCGMALGYRDAAHPINGWRTERASLDEFVRCELI